MFLLVLTLVSCVGLTKDDAKDGVKNAASKEANPVACGVGTALNQQTNQCIIVNNGVASTSTNPTPSTNPVQQTSTPSLPPSQLNPPPATNIECREPSGVFTELYYRQKSFVSGLLCGEACKADVLGMFRYQGNCPVDIYIEAGIQNQILSTQPLAISPYGYLFATKGSPSACDKNTHFNGVQFKQVQPNGVVVFELQPENYGVEGTYGMQVYAYTGCAKDGGQWIQGTQVLKVGFSNNYKRNTYDLNDIDNSWIKVI